MPEYVLRHNANDHGLYTLCYQYFMQRWEQTDIPEYDLVTDQLWSIGIKMAGKSEENNSGPEDVPQSIEQGREIPVLASTPQMTRERPALEHAMCRTANEVARPHF